MHKYCNSLGRYSRLETREVSIGDRPVGGNNPIRLQSMTNTSTMDIEATAAQCCAIISAGADYVRITAPGVRESEALPAIKQQMASMGCSAPLVADIHFNPRAAIAAASRVDKVRINPGNYVDKKGGPGFEWTDEAYGRELSKIAENLKPLLQECKKHGTAVRIGVNHGSLSDRIMSRYGDTPKGMVASLMEFLDICIAEDFHQVVLSIKASNTLIMVHSCRLAAAEMLQRGCVYPMHLGVTEAGEGEDGRIKSAAGIAALLHDGIGDTIRVSLTEAPEAEIPVCKMLAEHCAKNSADVFEAEMPKSFSPYAYSRRKTQCGHPKLGNSAKPVVVADMRGGKELPKLEVMPDFVLVDKYTAELPAAIEQITEQQGAGYPAGSYPIMGTADFVSAKPDILCFVKTSLADIKKHREAIAAAAGKICLMLKAETADCFRELRAAFFELENAGISCPVIICASCAGMLQEAQVKLAADTGPLFIDGFGDGIMLNAPAAGLAGEISIAFGVLQASRVRFSKTDYISCPSCGRTLFELQGTAQKIREKTSHLAGLKIGIMGCIVNGPGEMADADYGYVGSSPGKVNLYKGPELVMKNLPSSEAVDKLVQLIRDNGDWKEPAK
jgi:(E)-4-hydroxy-3-methylbut-2-enyl-diphosphate synthase